MGGNRQIARLRAKADRTDELAAKLEPTGSDSELMRQVITSLRSEVQNLRGLIYFLETAEKHAGHRR